MNKPLVLVVEDDRPIRNLIVTTLKAHDYHYLTAENGHSAIIEATSHNPDIVLLDLGLPDIDGTQVIESIRSWSNMPIIVISARSEDKDKITALDAGADDYLTKPFSIEELLARLRVTQRRLLLLQASGDADSPVFQNGKLKIDYVAGCAYLKGEELHLTPIEYKLLCLLSHNVGKVLTHTYITQQIWGSSWENDIASLRVFMATLRKKLELQKDSPQYTGAGSGCSPVHSDAYRRWLSDAAGRLRKARKQEIEPICNRKSFRNSRAQYPLGTESSSPTVWCLALLWQYTV